MRNKLHNRYTIWTAINLRNGSQLRANKRNKVIQIWHIDDYGEHCEELYCSRNETARNTLLKLAMKMSYEDNYQFEWCIKRMVETSH